VNLLAVSKNSSSVGRKTAQSQRNLKSVGYVKEGSNTLRQRVENSVPGYIGLYPRERNLHFQICENLKIFIIIIIINISCHRPFLPGTSRETAVIPTAQVSSFTLQYFSYYV